MSITTLTVAFGDANIATFSFFPNYFQKKDVQNMAVVYILLIKK